MGAQQKIKIYFLMLLAAIFLLPSKNSFAGDPYRIDKTHSKIQGSIQYTLIGKYHAAFEDFEGEVEYNQSKKSIDKVFLKIYSKSVKSKFPTLDKIVKSKRILDAEKYPAIVFESTKVEKRDEKWWIKGNITLHGVTKSLEFFFEPDFNQTVSGKKAITASGKWIIERKLFDIIWNKVLDQGGVVVGNHITVDWKIVAFPF